MKKPILLSVLLFIGVVSFVSCTDNTEETLKELKNEKQQQLVDPEKVKPPTNG